MLHQIKANQFYTAVLSPTENRKFRDFSRPLSDFPVLFKADLIFKDFSRIPLNSSTFHACANPGVF